jgi:hypothetical protein
MFCRDVDLDVDDECPPDFVQEANAVR